LKVAHTCVLCFSSSTRTHPGFPLAWKVRNIRQDQDIRERKTRRLLPQTDRASAFVVDRVEIFLMSSLLTVQNLVVSEFDRCSSYYVHACRRSQKFSGRRGTTSLVQEHGSRNRNTLLPKHVLSPNFLALSQNVTDGTVRSFASRPSRSPKVIGTDTDRLATYDFVLVFHSIVCSMGLSRTVFEIKDNICKIFLPTVHLASLLRGSLDFCNGSEN